MTREDITPGISIRHKKRYDGEGEYLIMSEIDLDTMHVSCVMACSEKYPELNGQQCYIGVSAIEKYFEIVN